MPSGAAKVAALQCRGLGMWTWQLIKSVAVIFALAWSASPRHARAAPVRSASISGQFGIQVGAMSWRWAMMADLIDIPLRERPALAEQNEVRCPDLRVVDAMQARIRGPSGPRYPGRPDRSGCWRPPGSPHVQWDRSWKPARGGACIRLSKAFNRPGL
jgi:hypothetical protein